ncbi:AraC family transcriptional regulator [Streptomyces sp. DSM 44915]|uniref:AraC family transcriptional regulator n=1 Tax=Streptomyces chisholmiae TaxID=3075540 RepID=A0ABU2JXZ2_9ACTN|nr:AraC family transcriptional regulator [Streptomyces sp. DSM 44915]MDT0269623.1 AraC family transcriptional regulator [Streptomyces sp. DSM 44915]
MVNEGGPGSLSEDELSGVLRHLQPVGVLSGGFVSDVPWVSGGAVGGELKVVAVLRGSARLATDGGLSARLGAGDVALLSGRSWLTLRGGAGRRAPREIAPPTGWSGQGSAPDGAGDVVVGGHLGLGVAGRELLRAALPPLSRLPGSAPGAHRLRSVLGLLLAEFVDGGPGSRFAAEQYARLVLLEAVRALVAGAALPPGWLRLLADERLRPAVRLIHEQPGRSWRLAQLARAAAMSRTTFADRFRRTGGCTPFGYLHRWRVVLAEHALRHTDTTVDALAGQLGYASPGAFSTAFRRTVGMPPGAYRRAHTGR